MDKVFVTGVSGYLGGHVALQALNAGHEVLGSVRSPDKARRVREALGAAGGDTSRLELCVLDLLHDDGWADAAAQARFTIHVASPFVTRMPEHGDDLVRPAVEGTRRAVRAALAAGHTRVVLTSSLAAIDGGHADYARTLTERDWTRVDSPAVNAYMASKTLAERHAWELANGAGEAGRLAVINPGALVGPLLDDDPGTSAALILSMLKGEMPIAPDVFLEYVDVRDVAAAHVAALTHPQAGGQRHIVAHESFSLLDIAALLREELPSHAAKLPRHRLPDWLARVMSLWDAGLRDSRPFIGVRKRSDHSRGQMLIGRPMTPVRAAVRATALSMIERGLV